MIAKHSPIKVIALQDKCKDSLRRSASGGAFAVIARHVLELGGVVFGACMDMDNGEVYHIAVSSVDQLNLLQGSKYVRSDLKSAYPECLSYLRNNRLVFFSGTPCQVSGLLSYLSRNLGEERPENLITADLICHGTPKQELFSAYLKWLKKSRGADGAVSKYCFREKQYGWGLYYSFEYRKGGKEITESGSAQDDPYYYSFAKGITHRDVCYRCSYACPERVGDFTLGDYWGIQKTGLNFEDNRGVSLVLLNTNLALKVFKQCEAGCIWAESTFEEAVRENNNLIHPTERNKEDAQVMARVEDCLATADYSTIFESLLKPSQTMKAKIRRAMPDVLRRALYKAKK